MVYAHTSPNCGGEWEPLEKHLNEVARLCAQYCKDAFLNEAEGYTAGLCHDLGKCGQLFQDVLHGYETKIDHESPGAYWLLKKSGLPAFDAALTIHAHHKGLVTDVAQEFGQRIHIDKAQGYGERRYACDSKAIDDFVACADISPLPISTRTRDVDAIASMLRVRMLLSALCDADYTATAAHFEQAEILLSALEPNFAKAFDYLTIYRQRLIATSTANEQINSLRRDLYDAAILASAWDSGVFSLTAPTGSGKTLAMLGFALRHAMKHGKQRIIFVFPYLTLIEQAAKEIRRALAPLSNQMDYIFEDHSQSRGDEDGSTVPSWGEPFIITTTIKFFESLFANKPAKVRHLHNIANSIVLFDEAQSLPFGYAPATLETLTELVKSYGVSVLFSTATQPSFDYIMPNWSPREIVSPELKLFERAKRISVCWPASVEKETSWEDLAVEILQMPQSLTVVNTRRQAANLITALQARQPAAPVFHLSTNMCVAHREDTLNLVRLYLDEKRPCVLVSTQCIEAGVDISFPVVYRALGPLDSVIQAFGRCNRHGERELGDARIFLPPLADRYYPDETYEVATKELLHIIMAHGDVDIDDPKAIRTAFEALTRSLKNEGLKGKYQQLTYALTRRDYVAINEHYHWIDRRGVNVIVPYGPKMEIYNELVCASHGKRLRRDWLAKAQIIGVNIMLRKQAQLRDYLQPITCHNYDETLETGWFYPIRNDVYNDTLGLNINFSDTEEDFIW